MGTFFSIKGSRWHLFVSLFLSTGLYWGHREMEYLRASLEKATIYPSPEKKESFIREHPNDIQDEITLRQSSIKRTSGKKVLRVRSR